jgi:hypothetical protein
MERPSRMQLLDSSASLRPRFRRLAGAWRPARHRRGPAHLTTPTQRASDSIWHVLADRLSDFRDVRSSPYWKGVRRAVLGYAHHWLTVTPARLTASQGKAKR